jgi:hypothetical protein
MVQDSGQAGVLFASSKKRGETFDNVVSQADLLVELHQDVFSRDWEQTAKNYADAKLMIYLLLGYLGPHGHQHRFPFLIGNEVLNVGWLDRKVVDVGHSGWVRPHRKAMIEIGADADQIFPMLVLISDLVDGPEGVIPSGVWSLGFDEVPLIGSQFLFNSMIAGHPRTWEWLRLPGVPVDASEGKPYARGAAPIGLNQGNNGLIQRRAQAKHDIDDIEGEVVGDIFVAACDYMGKLAITMDADRVGFRLNEPVDSRFEVIKLSLSSFDIFT